MLKVLDQIPHENGVTASEIAKKLNKSWTQTRDILKELEKMNLVRKSSSASVTIWFRND